MNPNKLFFKYRVLGSSLMISDSESYVWGPTRPDRTKGKKKKKEIKTEPTHWERAVKEERFTLGASSGSWDGAAGVWNRPERSVHGLVCCQAGGRGTSTNGCHFAALASPRCTYTGAKQLGDET